MHARKFASLFGVIAIMVYRDMQVTVLPTCDRREESKTSFNCQISGIVFMLSPKRYTCIPPYNIYMYNHKFLHSY